LGRPQLLKQFSYQSTFWRLQHLVELSGR
jgi:hypothetical protein